MKIFLSCPVPSGGIAEHANYQARAMEKIFRGDSGGKNCSVTLLCTPDFLDGRVVGYRKEEVFTSRFSVFGLFAGRFGEVLDRSLKIVCDQWRLAWEVFRRKPDAVLLASYSEYLSPLWVWPHWFLARVLGITYAANLHDPVRDYVVGPVWWHKLSVRLAYLPLSVGVVHQRQQEPSPVPSHVHVVEAPVGVYDLQEAPEDPEAIRAAWGVGGRAAPKADSGGRREEDSGSGKAENLKNDLTTEDTESTEGLAGLFLNKASGAAFSNPPTNELARDSENASPIRFADSPFFSPPTSHPPPATPAAPEVVFLAFGFIRNNKNLDLVIRALVDNPEAVLVVMGRVQSKKDKPLDFYRNLAKELGVDGRVKFFDGFVPDEKLASYFAAADVVVLTYDGTFRSQSGVLNVAARAKRLVLASAGESPLKDCVLRFRLGVFVEPDDLVGLKDGMAKLIDAKCEMRNGVGKDAGPDWEGYGNFASWDVNAQKVLEAMSNFDG